MIGKKKLFIPLILLTVIGLGIFQFHRPFPAPKYEVNGFTFKDNISANVTYPSYGQSAVGAVGYGLLGTNGTQNQVPTASTAKLITALAVLMKKPMTPGTTGETITLDATDVSYFEQHFINDGSVVKVAAGEKISQYDALTAMLLPSGNNMAETLARWAFGSQEAYTKYAGEMVKKLGASQTSVSDASGFSDDTVSTAKDMLTIASKVVQNPTLAEIVAKPTAVVPVAGTINNVNWLLGEEGVVGVKTGSTEAAGGCFVFAANRQIDGKTVQVIGAVLGAPSRNQAIADSKKSIKSMDANFRSVNPIKKSTKVGTYTSKVGEKIDIIVSQDNNFLVWNGSTLNYRFVEVHPVNQPTSVGYFTTDNLYSAPIYLTLAHPPKDPTLWQKLLRF